jgi:hypothetical protein
LTERRRKGRRAAVEEVVVLWRKSASGLIKGR